MDKSVIPLIVAVLFPFVFVGVWSTVCLMLSRMGGWRRLAESFPVRNEPLGRCFFMQSGKVGPVSYGGCLTIHSSPKGLRLSVWLPFRLGHPPLFIPWDAIRNPKIRRFLWAENVVFDVGARDVVTLQLSKRVFEGHQLAV